jgi:hypothetical protein
VKSIRAAASDVRRRVDTFFYKRRLPTVVTLTEFEAAGVRFEVSNLTEHFRVVLHGGETEYTAAMLQDLRADDVLFDIGAKSAWSHYMPPKSVAPWLLSLTHPSSADSQSTLH